MKVLYLFLLLALSVRLFGQDKFIGHYRDHFGSRIQLHPNNTFKYTWSIDMSSSWTKGTWTTSGDTIYLQAIPTYDTIKYKGNDGTFTDKTILSVDEIPEKLSYEEYTARGLSTGRQDIQSYPDKLFFKKSRLYNIHKGQLVTKKQKAFWTNKKWNPWFFRSYD